MITKEQAESILMFSKDYADACAEMTRIYCEHGYVTEQERRNVAKAKKDLKEFVESLLK